MASSGAVDLWRDTFHEELLPQLLDLVIKSWATFPQPSGSDLEVPITKKFVVHLTSNQNRSIHLFRINWESNILDEKGDQKGRIDICFTHGYNTSEYFSLECKLLNKTDEHGKWSSLAGEYIDEGVMRYVNEQYSGGSNGGMIGYVMDGDVGKALQCVNKAIKNRKEKLGIEGNAELKRSSIRPKCPQTRETRHLIRKDCFIIHHLFLPVTSRN